jgi:YD repeat-containing protein
MKFRLVVTLLLSTYFYALIAKADIVNYSPSCNARHPEMGYLALGVASEHEAFFQLLDLNGKVKRVVRKWEGASSKEKEVLSRMDKESEFYFDKSGHLTLSRVVGESVQTYEYDSEGRISRILRSSEEKTQKGTNLLLSHVYLFSYFAEKNMTVVKQLNQPGNVWGGSETTIRSTEPNGDSICYFIEASERGVAGKKLVLSADKSKFSEVGIAIGKVVGRKASEKDADALMLAALKEMRSVSAARDCRYTESWTCSYVDKEKEGDFDKFILTTPISDGTGSSWDGNEWWQEGVISELVSNSWDAIKLPDGSLQHTSFQYEIDGQGNWIRQGRYVTEPATLTNEKTSLRKIGAIVREIEYYK